MASLMKKVLKGVTSRWEEGSGKSHVISPPPPMCPPSPDLSGLTPDEIAILKDVFRRQEEFERQEHVRVRQISDDVEKYEKTVQRQASTKGPIKHVDIRLCRLCYKTKFADGIGRLCSDCHKRVCNTCGTFSRSRWDRKKNRNVRGRWRCNMCLLRREALCRTGSWYHGESFQEGTNDDVIEKLKTSVSMEMESDNCDKKDVYNSDGEKIPSGNRTDPELYRSGDTPAQQVQSSVRKHRRRSLPVSHVIRPDEDEDDDEADENGHHWLHERRMLRQKRQLRRLRRRNMPDSKTSDDLNEALTSDGSRENDENSYEALSDPDRSDRAPSVRIRKRRASRISLKDRSKSQSATSAVDYSSESTSDMSYATKESSVSDGACSPTLISKIKRQNAVYCSSSSSVLSDTKHSDSQGGPTSPLPVRNVRDPISRSPVHGAKEKHVTPSRLELLNRRVTLQKCELISPCDDARVRRLGTLKMLKPHEVILHRDKGDRSHRTGGLGMRVVGGKDCDNGTLGAFVVMITKGGPADMQGRIRIGDQIIEWNGVSLTNVTFEETRDIVNQSGNVVQLKVIHRHIKKRLSEDSETPRVARIESEDWGQCCNLVPFLPPDSLPSRPRRRMLPKTPIEMKKETRRITGRILTRINYLPSTERLEISILRAEQLSLPESSQQRVPNPLVLVHMLPQRRLMPFKETDAKQNTRNPEWDKTFYFHNISEDQLLQKAIEITVWSQAEKEDMFLGEILLDLSDAELEYEALWYNLEDHDENSSPLPERKRPLEIPDTVLTTADSRNGNSPNASPNCPRRSLPVTPNDHQIPRSPFKRSPSADRKSPCLSPPRSPTNQSDSSFQSGHRNSFTSKVKRKMSCAVSKVSSSLSVSEKRDSVLSDDTSPGEMGRSRSFGDDSRDPSPNRPRSRKTSSSKSVNLDLLAPPRPLSRTNSQSSFYENETETDDDPYGDLPLTPDRPASDGDDITSSLGPGQVPPKPSAEHLVCGDIGLGFAVSKGQLEVNVISARNMVKTENPVPTDTYVKTYLVEGKKIIQKKKTQIVKGGGDLVFKKQIKYSACNVHGRHMKVNVWERIKGFDKKKSCLGETVVRLDSLDLSRHTTGWYKMFTMNATDLGSSESLYHW
ncbi:regulating synaptic membrane exocytosis protein 1-like isoform X1 [Haliotis rufescens]|uniref:regulating synaptic membrane exocytosis protein 1-like isoform X1 n=1 Tax=Haliotis rufescens TaxID=6454 RepID=UPI001EAFE0C3|nr:regulating synaptic membrane exocytosis protein 1-like isoform X1 [Haliotis rufescens]XP_046357038.1 regulating synaptic membrane exocytosis protein 1-like isoform X1 [Haliotis rufescens]